MGSFEKILEYSKCVCDQIRWKKVRTEISREIETHLLDQRDAYIAAGADEKTATEHAIVQMGDPISVGTQLDRIHRPKPQWGMLILAASLVFIGFYARILVYGGLIEPISQLTSIVIGLSLMVAAYYSDFTLIGRYPVFVYFSIVALSAATLQLSPTVNGKAYYAGFVTLLFPLGFAAIVFAVKNKGYWGILLCGISFTAPAIIAMLVPSFSSFLLFTVSGLILLCVAISKNWFGIKKLHGYLLVFIPTVSILLSFLLGFILTDSYRWKRLQIAINPTIDPNGAGYMGTAVRALLGGSRLFGTGVIPTQYSTMEFPLSRASIQSDYLLTYLIFKLGWIAFIGITALLTFYIVMAFIRCFRQKSGLGLFVSLSVLLTFTIQVMGYVLSNLGVQLTTPISLPLISYGKIVTILNLFLIGIMLSVFRTGDSFKDKNPSTVRKNSFITWNVGKQILTFGKKLLP